tara:strand:- start:1686 stop:2024 length:339 start_codon:yes stop_codon:yes gene_type:complete
MSAIDNAKKHFDDIDTKVLEVPEWGEDAANPLKIYCKPITLQETSKFMKLAKDDEIQLLAYVLIYKALDSEGEKLFTIGDRSDFLNRVDRNVLIRVASEIMGNIDQEQIKKK